MEKSNTTRPDNVIRAHVPSWDIYAVIKAKEAINKEAEHADGAATEAAGNPEVEHADGTEKGAPEIPVADVARVAGVAVDIGRSVVGDAEYYANVVGFFGELYDRER